MLPEIVLDTETAVGPYPDVASYIISAGFGEVALTPEQLAAYEINFINEGEEAGLLTVNKKDLIITPDDVANPNGVTNPDDDTPKDVTIVYGEAVTVPLNYFGVDEEGELENLELEHPQLHTLIENAHDADFFDENTLILINKLRGVVNEQKILEFLNNGSWMSSERIIQNKLRGVVNGMNVIDLEVENFEYLIDPTTNKLRGVVNKLRGVVNGQNLLNNQIELYDPLEPGPIENKLRGVVNSTGLLNENGFEAYNSIFAVVDFDDGATEEDPDRTIDKVYATNLLTGLDVTPDEGDPSKIYPGAFLANLSANFNITYQSSNITVSHALLQVQTPNIEIEYGTTLTIEDITSVIEGYVYEETSETVFPDGIPYYFIKVGDEDNEANRIEIGDLKERGDYLIKIGYPQNYTPQNYTITNIVDETYGTLKVNKAVLYVKTGDLVIDQGTDIDPSLISITIDEDYYVYGESVDDVFPQGIQYNIEDEEGNAYEFESGDTGVYFIKIKEPDPINYRIEYTRLGTVYINSNDANRKIRTYTDCVEADPDGLNYIAHFRYENPNDEAIYILEGSENQLTGLGAADYGGELPIKFLPGEHTFEIRFDGNTLKWELISLDSNHKTSTTTNVNANSNKCDSSNTTNESGIPIYNLYPNPVKEVSTCIGCEPGILYIEQDISAEVTLNVFDFYGIQIPIEFNRITPLNGTLDMNGLETGIFFIRLSTGNDVQVFSVVKD